jgi:hypothetical protein
VAVEGTRFGHRPSCEADWSAAREAHRRLLAARAGAPA